MNYKLQGEAALRAAYDAANNDKLGYVIIRPGGLMDGDKVGPGSIELNQGDTISGEVNRSDVADCAVAAAISKTIPSRYTTTIFYYLPLILTLILILTIMLLLLLIG